MLTFLIVTGIFFTYINGVHDGGVVVATMISSKSISPKKAVILAGIGDFLGAILFGTAVAKTVGIGIVDSTFVLLYPAEIGMIFVISALLGGITWNVITWILKLPSSSSHALVGGLIGAGIMAYGVGSILWINFLLKVVLAMLISPLLGFLGGYFVLRLEVKIFRHGKTLWRRRIKKIQWLSAALMASMHGSQDAQKSMGMISLGIAIASGSLDFEVQFWVMLACAGSMALGTMTGGWNIIKTVGMRIFKVTPMHSLASQVATIGALGLANIIGAPVSTVQVSTSSVMGVGSGDNPKHVNWKIVEKVAASWILTIPAAALTGGVVFLVIKAIWMTFC